MGAGNAMRFGIASLLVVALLFAGCHAPGDDSRGSVAGDPDGAASGGDRVLIDPVRLDRTRGDHPHPCDPHPDRAPVGQVERLPVFDAPPAAIAARVAEAVHDPIRQGNGSGMDETGPWATGNGSIAILRDADDEVVGVRYSAAGTWPGTDNATARQEARSLLERLGVAWVESDWRVRTDARSVVHGDGTEQTVHDVRVTRPLDVLGVDLPVLEATVVPRGETDRSSDRTDVLLHVVYRHGPLNVTRSTADAIATSEVIAPCLVAMAGVPNGTGATTIRLVEVTIRNASVVYAVEICFRWAPTDRACGAAWVAFLDVANGAVVAIGHRDDRGRQDL